MFFSSITLNNNKNIRVQNYLTTVVSHDGSVLNVTLNFKKKSHKNTKAKCSL